MPQKQLTCQSAISKRIMNCFLSFPAPSSWSRSRNPEGRQKDSKHSFRNIVQNAIFVCILPDSEHKSKYTGEPTYLPQHGNHHPPRHCLLASVPHGPPSPGRTGQTCSPLFVQTSCVTATSAREVLRIHAASSNISSSQAQSLQSQCHDYPLHRPPHSCLWRTSTATTSNEKK